LTFLFKYLAKHKLLRHIDYLSTVSGGGYFGGFIVSVWRSTSDFGLAHPDAASLKNSFVSASNVVN
jgi:hypothetical protein